MTNLIRKIKNKLILGSILFLMPTLASAHVKWFAEPGEPVRHYELTDSPVIIWIAICAILVAIGIYLECKLKTPAFLKKYITNWGDVILSLGSIGFGLSLLIFSAMGFLFAPNLPAEGSLLLTLQALAGAMILLGFYERMGALFVLMLFVFGIKEHGFVEMLDAVEMVSFALFVFIVGRPKWQLAEEEMEEKVFRTLKEYAVPILRFGTGLNLFILGFSEKILAPALSQNFLTHYHWNFMQLFGFSNFSNYWFAFSAGVTESLIGLFLMLGLITRTTVLALAGFLVTTLILLGPLELVGHLPHFAIAIVLLLFGSGEKLKLWAKK